MDRQAEEERYPLIINGRCRNGMPEFSGTFVDYPFLNGFRWASYLNSSAADHISFDSELSSTGYRQLYQQNFLCANERLYQATWILD